MKKFLPTLVLLYTAFIASAQIDMLDGLQGHYPFNGDVKDVTDNHYDGTLHGFAHVNDARLIIGDNHNDYLTLPSAVMDGLSDFTIVFHVAFKDFHNNGDDQMNQVLCGWGSDLDRLGIAYKRNIHSWVFTVNGEAKTLLDNTVTQESLLCMFVMRQSDSLKVFIDAVEVASWLIDTTPLSITNLVAGQHATCTAGCFGIKQGLNGHLENLAFWNRALTADEIDLGCHPPHAHFIYSNVNCTDGVVDFTNLSEHSDFYAWNFGDGNASNEMDPTNAFSGGAGTYDVMLIATNQWNHLSDTLIQQVIATNTSVDAGITPDGSTSICDGSSVLLSASPAGAASYQWNLNGNPIDGATDANYEASQSGDYSVSVTNGTGCSASSGTVSVSISASPTASVTPSEPVSVCEGTTQVYSANTGNDLSYQWQFNGNPINGATNSSFEASASGSYSVVETNGSGCTAVSNSASFLVNAIPVAVISPDGSTTICDGSSVNLSATSGNGFTYQWQLNGNDISGATDASYAAWQSGSYTVNITSAAGCSDLSDGVDVSVNETPVASINPTGDISACAGSGQIFSANIGVGITYQWMQDGNPISGETNATYSTNSSGAYSVVETNSNGCSATSNTTTLTVNANPDVTISTNGNTTFCEGASVELTAVGNGTLTYQWKLNGNPIDGETNDTYVADQSGTYTVKVVDQNGCKNASAPVDVTVNENPSASIDPASDISFCEGGSQTYTANSGGGLSYQWTWNGSPIEGETNSTYTATSSGTYAVIVTNTSDCSATSSSSTLTVNANPVASIDPASDISLCDGASQLYNANTGLDLTYQWTWNGDPIEGATNASYTATSGGSYAVIIWNANGCSATSSSSTLTLNANPEATIDPSGEIAFCEGGSQTFNANDGDFTYQWTWNGDPIEGATNFSYTATSSGSYAVIVWNASGCSATSESASVTVNALPEAAIDGEGFQVCEGSTVEMNANTGNDLSYQWQHNGEDISGATNSSYQAGAEGSYTVIVTNAAGCSATSSSVDVTVNPLPQVTLGNDTTVCDTANFVLDAGAGFEQYSWNDGATTQTHEVNATGEYTVTVTDANGCTNSASVTVTVDICTGISEATFANGINIYPNPAFGSFVVEINVQTADHVKIDLINTLGQTVRAIYEGQLSGTVSKEVDGKDLTKGVYYVRMNIDNNIITKKVVIGD